MNDENISISELIEEYYRGKITKGTILRTLENCYSSEYDSFLVYADSNYSARADINQILKTKRDVYKPEKSKMLNMSKTYLLRKTISNKKRDLEITVILFIGKKGEVKIDTQIFEAKGNKFSSYWFSQIEDFEDTLEESDNLIVRKIDGMILDVKETRNEALVLTSSTKQPILKRFRKLEMD